MFWLVYNKDTHKKKNNILSDFLIDHQREKIIVKRQVTVLVADSAKKFRINHLAYSGSTVGGRHISLH